MSVVALSVAPHTPMVYIWVTVSQKIYHLSHLPSVLDCFANPNVQSLRYYYN